MKKKYVIVGDNNFWYATTDEITDEQLTAELKEIKEGIGRRDYEAETEPNKLFVYEVTEVQRVDL